MAIIVSLLLFSIPSQPLQEKAGELALEEMEAFLFALPVETWGCQQMFVPLSNVRCYLGEGILIFKCQGFYKIS